MLLSLHASTDRTDPRRWPVGSDRHVPRTPGCVPTQHLHADERRGHRPARPNRTSGRWSSARAGVLRHFHPSTGADSHPRLDGAPSSGAYRRPSCRHVPDGALVRSLRPASQAEGGQQHVACVGACCVRRHSEHDHGDCRGPHDICEGVEPVSHSSLRSRDDLRPLLQQHVDPTSNHSHIASPGCDPYGLITKRVVQRKRQLSWGWPDDDDHATDTTRSAA